MSKIRNTTRCNYSEQFLITYSHEQTLIDRQIHEEQAHLLTNTLQQLSGRKKGSLVLFLFWRTKLSVDQWIDGAYSRKIGQKPGLPFSEKSISRTKIFFWFAHDQWTKVAAILFLTLLSTVLLNKISYTPPAQEEYTISVPAPVTKITRFGEKMTIKLPDGSSVWLNSGSELQFPEKFDSLERRVTLPGQGFFEVIPDPDRPFRVETGKIVTEAFLLRGSKWMTLIWMIIMGWSGHSGLIGTRW